MCKNATATEGTANNNALNLSMTDEIEETKETLFADLDHFFEEDCTLLNCAISGYDFLFHNYLLILSGNCGLEATKAENGTLMALNEFFMALREKINYQLRKKIELQARQISTK